MLARKQADGKLKVTLFAAELQGDGRYSKLLGSSPRAARLALLKILTEAAAITDFLADYKNLTAEIIPNAAGGCVIYYSCAAPNRTKAKIGLCFANSAPLLQLLGQLAQNGWGQSLCSLYGYKQGYALVLFCPITIPLQMLAEEYALTHFTESIPLARVQEYGQPLVERRSVQKTLGLLQGISPEGSKP